jgi:hypothetical protein
LASRGHGSREGLRHKRHCACDQYDGRH